MVLASTKECTNCKACINICPKNAIKIQEDEYGFEYPYIDKEICIECGLCEKTCTKINQLEKHYPLKTIVAQMNNDDLLQKSSSGGIFAQLAHYVLKNNGVVFGCAMEKTEENFEIKHIFIEREEELYKLQGSKYVQSDVGKTYKQVKEFLEQGKQVLYAGTPCQNAGLKVYLKDEYKNLLCVDLSCTGVPNEKIFNDYVKYIEKNIIKKTIKDFKFRSKEHLGWACGSCVFFYEENGQEKQYVVPKEYLSYTSLFVNMNILRENCYNCKFSGLERISDITIADAWGINIEYPYLQEKGLSFVKGVSLVLLNTEKGKDILEKVQKDLMFCDINVEKLVKYNHPLRCSSVLTNGRERYLQAYKKGGYEAINELYNRDENARYKKQSKVDCLLMTMYANPNYGSILTSYALQRTLSKIGYSSEIINYEKLPFICKDFYHKYCQLSEKIKPKKLYKLNKKTNTFIIGADNLINCKTDSFEYVTRNLFNFTHKNKRRIMVASSMGDWDGKLPRIKHFYFKALLKRFNYLSVREKHGQGVFSDIFDCKSDWLNDPIFYLEKENYIDIAKDSKIDFSNRIMQYILYPTLETEDIVDTLSKKYQAETIIFEGNMRAKNYTAFDKNISVADWLSAIIHSKLIITDSFHCTAFALMFNCPVVCIKNTRATVRFISLFEKLGINIPLIEVSSDFDEKSLLYDVEKVNEAINNIRENAIEKIKIAMKAKQSNDFKNEFYLILYNLTDAWKKINKNIFSIKNQYSGSKKHKVITILGLKIKIRA